MENQTLELDEKRVEKTEKQIGFWWRQFETEPTKKQKIFDSIFGIVLPVLCFAFDPTVFKGGLFSSEAFLADYKLFAYSLSFFSIMSILAFIIWGKEINWINGFLCGLFGVGAIISLSIGILILPISLLGLIILIGALGFTPLFSAFVYIRNAIRAFEYTQPNLKQSTLIYSVALSAIFAVSVPYLLNVKAQNGLETMKNGNAQVIRSTAQRFKYIAPLVNFDSLIWEYDSENFNSERNIALAESFKQLTGNDIDVVKTEKLKMRMAE